MIEEAVSITAQPLLSNWPSSILSELVAELRRGHSNF